MPVIEEYKLMAAVCKYINQQEMYIEIENIIEAREASSLKCILHRARHRHAH